MYFFIDPDSEVREAETVEEIGKLFLQCGDTENPYVYEGEKREIRITLADPNKPLSEASNNNTVHNTVQKAGVATEAKDGTVRCPKCNAVITQNIAGIVFCNGKITEPISFAAENGKEEEVPLLIGEECPCGEILRIVLCGEGEVENITRDTTWRNVEVK